MHKSISMPDFIVHEIQIDSIAKSSFWNAGLCKMTKTLSFPKDLMNAGGNNEEVDYDYAACLATPLENVANHRMQSSLGAKHAIYEKRLEELFLRFRRSLRRKS